jgi:hypothetical protein
LEAFKFGGLFGKFFRGFSPIDDPMVDGGIDHLLEKV